MAKQERLKIVPETVLMTQVTYNLLEQKLVQIEVDKSQKGLEIGDSGDTSDWHENFAFEDAHRQFELLLHQARKLRAKLQHAKIIEPRQEVDVIGLGNAIRFKYDDEEKSREVTLLAPSDSGVRPNWISQESPLGIALLGKKTGEELTLQVRGKTHKLQILEIRLGNLE